VEQHCNLNPHYFTVTGKLRQAHTTFCKEQGADALNSTTLSLKLQREFKITKGQKKINGKNQRVYFGIELEDDPDA
jgi:hypothetical protein